MERLLSYVDPGTGVRGWLAYDGVDGPLAAGGCRVQTQLDADTLVGLASRMTLKQRVLGINVDGAKCGIALDPRSTNKDAALSGFLGFLRDELMTRFSMGSDMGTQWGELQTLAARHGIPSVKYAVRAAQGFSDDEFFARIGLLDEPVGMLTLGQRRAGQVLAHAAIAAAQAARGPATTTPITVALQGFGNMGRAVAASLLEEQVRIIAVSDEYGCLVSNAGLDAVSMLNRPHGQPVPQLDVSGEVMATEAIFTLPVDVLILAANKDAVSVDQAHDIPVGAITVGSNCGLSVPADEILQDRGVVVVPDFIGGIGGSASMEALFGPEDRPTAKSVVANLGRMARDLVDDLCSTARNERIGTLQAAEVLAGRTVASAGDRPYGHCPYLRTNSLSN